MALRAGADPEEPSVLKEYVEHREEVLDRIGDFYGVAPAKCNTSA